jgi:hypothetical protein
MRARRAERAEKDAVMNTTLTCAFTQWHPGLGDNNVMGWLTVVVYLIAAGTSARAAAGLSGPEPLIKRERGFWWISAAIMLFLAVNKQLDLQTLFTLIGRCHARLSGWYDIRRIVQRDFILGIAGAGVVALGLLAFLLRGILGRVWPALLGLAFVCLFVVVRAASFHHMDVLLGTWVLGIKMNWLLELPGPALVAAVAQRRRRAVLAG